MQPLATLFDHAADFDPAGDFAAFLKGVPAKWVVYLLTDAADRPVQLLCVRNLRYSLERRLGLAEEEGRTKRVDYRGLVRRVYWRRVDSAFEADVVYWEVARAVFPSSYRGMMAFRPAWFVQVDPAAEFPRYVRTEELDPTAGELIGPLEEKNSAQRLIQLAEDTFDLCRYYNVLTEAPKGKACAYKEMGRCAAPCDGTVPMEHYREAVAASLRAMVDPSAVIRDETERMKRAAGELKFELAGRIKGRIEQLSQFGAGPFRHARPMEAFQFLVIQRGPKAGTAKLFLVTPNGVEEIVGLIAEPKGVSDLLRHVLAEAAARASAGWDDVARERVGLVAHHLFLPKQTQGVFLRISDIDDRSVVQGYRDLRKQKEAWDGSAGAEEVGEGVVREAQAVAVGVSGAGDERGGGAA